MYLASDMRRQRLNIKQDSKGLAASIARAKVNFEIEIFSKNLVIINQYTQFQNHIHIFVNLITSYLWQKNM
jgi:hypothetical protein